MWNYFFSSSFCGTFGWYVIQLQPVIDEILAMFLTVPEITFATFLFNGLTSFLFIFTGLWVYTKEKVYPYCRVKSRIMQEVWRE
jgi:hypothetical protein